MTPSTPDDGLRDFRAVYRAHYGLVWHALHRFGVATTQVDDAVQDVFVVAYRRRASYRGPSPKPWLYGIARRVASNYRRSTRRRTQRDQALPRPTRPTVDDGPLAAIEGLERYLAGLGAEDRELLLLSELEGMTGPELASVTGRNVQTIYTRVRKLKVELGQHMSGHTSGHMSGLERVRRERPQASARSWALLVPALRSGAPAGTAAATSGAGMGASAGASAGGAWWGWIVGAVGVASLAVVASTRPASNDPERSVASRSIEAPIDPIPAEPGTKPMPSPPASDGTPAISSAAPPTVDPEGSPDPRGASSPATDTRGDAPRSGHAATPRAELAASPADDLRVETELLRRASTELAAGDASAALRTATEHGRRFPDSTLSDLRTAVRIEALCRVGKAAQARGEARLFLRERPGSPVAERVERACASGS